VHLYFTTEITEGTERVNNSVFSVSSVVNFKKTNYSQYDYKKSYT
jgi:hypothetical protein